MRGVVMKYGAPMRSSRKQNEELAEKIRRSRVPLYLIKARVATMQIGEGRDEIVMAYQAVLDEIDDIEKEIDGVKGNKDDQ